MASIFLLTENEAHDALPRLEGLGWGVFVPLKDIQASNENLPNLLLSQPLFDVSIFLLFKTRLLLIAISDGRHRERAHC